MKRSYGVVHGLAECRDCEWTSQSYKNIQAVASLHARKYGHRVTGEVGAAFTYDGEGKPQGKP